MVVMMCLSPAAIGSGGRLSSADETFICARETPRSEAEVAAETDMGTSRHYLIGIVCALSSRRDIHHDAVGCENERAVVGVILKEIRRQVDLLV